MTVHQHIVESQTEDMRDAARVINEGRPLGRQIRDEVIVVMLYDLGLRNDELRGIKPDGMIRLNQGELYLPSSVQKGYPYSDKEPDPATLEMGRSGLRVTRLLRDYLSSDWYQAQESEYLLPTRQSDQISEEGLRQVVRRLAVEADVQPYRTDGERGEPEDLTPHDIRHSIGNWMLRDGYTMTNLRNRLRHQHLSTTERVYEHYRRG